MGKDLPAIAAVILSIDGTLTPQSLIARLPRVIKYRAATPENSAYVLTWATFGSRQTDIEFVFDGSDRIVEAQSVMTLPTSEVAIRALQNLCRYTSRSLQRSPHWHFHSGLKFEGPGRTAVWKPSASQTVSIQMRQLSPHARHRQLSMIQSFSQPGANNLASAGLEDLFI